MTACAVAALTIYDMCKSAEKASRLNRSSSCASQAARVGRGNGGNENVSNHGCCIHRASRVLRVCTSPRERHRRSRAGAGVRHDERRQAGDRADEGFVPALCRRQAQPIEYFDAFDLRRRPVEPPALERPRRERRLYLLLFDLTFATPPRIARAQKAAEQVVAHSNPATDFFAVATYSSNRGVFFLSPFLSDRIAVARAIFTLRASAANDPLGLALASAERAKWVTAMEPGGAAAGSDDDISSFLGSEVAETLKGGQANQDMQLAQGNRLIEYQLEGLGEAAARFGLLEGQKHLLVFTEGFDSTRLTDIKAKGRPPNLDARLLDTVKKMHDAFVSAGVTLDSVDIKGVRHTFTDLENDALYMLSRGTGGRVIANRNDLVEAVGTLVQAQRMVYVLGFRQGGRKQGRISVHVNGLPRGAEVSYREGFGYTPQKPRPRCVAAGRHHSQRRAAGWCCAECRR